MSRVSTRILVLLISCVVLVPGCAELFTLTIDSMDDAARAPLGEGPRRYHCGALRVDGHEVADATDACMRFRYEQARVAGSGAHVPSCSCVLISDSSVTSGSEAAPLPETWTEAQLASALAPARAAADQCAPGVSSFALRIVLGVHGRVDDVRSDELSETQLACFRGALAHVQATGEVRTARTVSIRIDAVAVAAP